jgi:hypothetical protein
LGFLWRRAEENRALRAHANVAGDGGCGPDDDDDDDGTEAFGRILAMGKHGLAFFFGLLLGGGGGVAVVSSASVAADSSDNDIRGGGLWRRHVDSVSAVDADEQEKLL